MTVLAARRKRELLVKLQTLDRELKDWSRLTSDPPFRRHYSQVTRINAMLDGLLESMTHSTAWTNPAEPVALAKATEWERRILTAHAIWEVFRGKLAQRFDGHFQPRLAAYDDLAWACYEPAMLRYSSAKREPPLVYLNATWSAFLRRRDRSFEKDVDAGKDARDLLDDADYRATIAQLPVLLLGLPWFQIAHLPSALMIAHEIGHAVEWDFELTSRLDSALHAAGLNHDADWRFAASEVFADLYGVLCLGRSFAAALIDLLAADKALVAAENEFTVYPTRTCRVALVVEALRYFGLNDEATAVDEGWEAEYGRSEALPSHRADVPKVVAAIYGKDAGIVNDGLGLDLGTLLSPPDNVTVGAVAQHAVLGNRTELAKQGDARILFCALRHVSDSDQYQPAQIDRAADRLVAQVVDRNAAVFRYRGAAVVEKSDVDAQIKQASADDAAAGRKLAELLRLDRDAQDA